MLIEIVVGFILVVIVFVINRQGDIVVEDVPELTVTSPAFKNGGMIPEKYTGNGADFSPELKLSSLAKEAVSIAVIVDDVDHPLVGVYNHWLIWNVPVQEVIPAKIPQGEQVSELANAVQGVGYGKHRYRGPKPPFGSHRYKYHVFVLDTKLDLPASTKKKALLTAMEGHILQHGYLIGEYAAK
ncbi:YbhB/YbcL family Raf kinase inhibitor-like protein [Enterococcus malodoratus]|uniref:YbhB/YbcL family Raf kinase inhibitor-like protein n=1 Tax=Enterococcus malodoratus ATCC 43197 TaxID=1158601 RepID=R2QZE0_9ENTE|nr:YbhB/YbcL family Raf kinase inhibitor-like protein [Enterococcus malodoratus]EOH76795.1 YbhB/YbcL family Raf kinase inhibitor-like protein [Enterococcus malodoratus ATCC 43197]EOT63504.1 YbhB/YbcL family Raf kinase inhibitor-like protein [Enterococcus malodoratus ATCC 43197]OJG65000.1 YbhB/YbcL family Raf kinase inhibitor-like protein [Enterococcus malodoratus]SPW69381.1 putative kinase inhibitor protein [Enterococcus malodoratus]STD65825.1 putative kinase inhibitor protein [Enterococcus ma